jgi:hypothetical protein
MWISVEKLMTEISLDHLAQKFFCVLGQSIMTGDAVLNGMPHLTRADFAESQVWWEAQCACSRRNIPIADFRIVEG